MSTPTDNYLRLQETPPDFSPPQAGFIDFFNDPTTGNLVRRNSRGVESVVGSSDFRYDPVITGLTGGGTTNLDGIATVDLDVGRIQVVIVSNIIQTYHLVAGTNAEQSPGVIRPNDYNATTNAKFWVSSGSFVTYAAPEDEDAIVALPYADQFHYWSPATTVSQVYFTLPSAALSKDGQEQSIFSEEEITAISVSCGAGATMGGTTLTTIPPRTVQVFKYISSASIWLHVT